MAAIVWRSFDASVIIQLRFKTLIQVWIYHCKTFFLHYFIAVSVIGPNDGTLCAHLCFVSGHQHESISSWISRSPIKCLGRILTSDGSFATESVLLNDSLTRKNQPVSPFQLSRVCLLSFVLPDSTPTR